MHTRTSGALVLLVLLRTAHQHGTGVILIDASTCQPSHCLGPEGVQAFFIVRGNHRGQANGVLIGLMANLCTCPTQSILTA